MKKKITLWIVLLGVCLCGVSISGAQPPVQFANETYVLGDIQIDGYTVNTYILSGQKLEDSVRQIDITYSPLGKPFEGVLETWKDELKTSLAAKGISYRGGYCAGGTFLFWTDKGKGEPMAGFFIRKFTPQAVIEFSYVDDKARFEKEEKAGTFMKWVEELSGWEFPRRKIEME